MSDKTEETMSNQECNHITLVKQTGPMDGGLKSKRYVCKGCGESFKAEIATIEVKYGKSAREVRESGT